MAFLKIDLVVLPGGATPGSEHPVPSATPPVRTAMVTAIIRAQPIKKSTPTNRSEELHAPLPDAVNFTGCAFPFSLSPKN
jgi:hypothetical protein